MNRESLKVIKAMRASSRAFVKEMGVAPFIPGTPGPVSRRFPAQWAAAQAAKQADKRITTAQIVRNSSSSSGGSSSAKGSSTAGAKSTSTASANIANIVNANIVNGNTINGVLQMSRTRQSILAFECSRPSRRLIRLAAKDVIKMENAVAKDAAAKDVAAKKTPCLTEEAVLDRVRAGVLFKGGLDRFV